MNPKKAKEALDRLTKAQCDALFNDWHFWARDNQLPPKGNWKNWLFNAGRGAGKTRTGSEWVRHKIKNGYGFGSLIAATAADARDVMVEGESGLLSVCWEGDRDINGCLIGRPIYEPSKRQVTWENGAKVKLYSAEEPDRLRGPQSDFGWCDELAAWARLQETWDMYQFGLRLGDSPQTMITTTPRPLKLLKELLKSPDTVVSTGSTFDNADNLAPAFLETLLEKYDGTRLGRQELHAEILEDVEGALWKEEFISRVEPGEEPDLEKLVVAVDPSGGGDEIGIVAAGRGVDGLYYVLADKTCNGSPDFWGKQVVRLYSDWGADRVVGESNFGGDMVRHVIETAAQSLNSIGSIETSVVKYVSVTASRGKVLRAEPVSALYEQGKVFHAGKFAKMEQEMFSFHSDWNRTRDGSPNRLDALVWALTELMINKPKNRQVASI